MALSDEFQRGYDEAHRRYKIGNALLGYGAPGKTMSPVQSVQAAGMSPPMSGAPGAGIGRTPSPAAPIAPKGSQSQVL